MQRSPSAKSYARTVTSDEPLDSNDGRITEQHDQPPLLSSAGADGMSPFKSEAQRKFLHAKHPEIAKRWEANTQKAPLPKKAKKK